MEVIFGPTSLGGHVSMQGEGGVLRLFLSSFGFWRNVCDSTGEIKQFIGPHV